MILDKEQDKLKELVEQHNQASEQIQMLQSSIADLRLQIAKQQGVVEALDSIKEEKEKFKGSPKDA
jgi:prefoldin subunit 5|tara:strand:- start:18278 stop:18475 length:198 start_codon:yes stop_codon:yes gene_type:complete